MSTDSDGAPSPSGAAVYSHIDGYGAVLQATGERQYDMYQLRDREWTAMSRGQRQRLLDHANVQTWDDPTDQGPLAQAVARAHTQYWALTATQRRSVVHPRHLDTWLRERQLVEVVAPDLTMSGAVPSWLAPASEGVPDEGPQPVRRAPVYLTLAIQVDAPVEAVLKAVERAIVELHPPAARRPRRGSGPRPTRERYADVEIARMLDWYYHRAAGEPLKVLAAKCSGGTERAVTAMARKIARQLQWLRRELGHVSPR